MRNRAGKSNLHGGLCLTLREGDIFKISSPETKADAFIEFIVVRNSNQIRLKVLADKRFEISNIYSPNEWEKSSNG